MLELCQQHQLLRELDRSSLLSLLTACELLTLPRGTVLLHYGARNQRLYFLLQGRLEVELPNDGAGHRLFLESGDVAGEMSVIQNQPAGARVTAVDECQVVAMPEAVFWQHYCSHAPSARAFLAHLVGRMRRTNSALVEAVEHRVRLEGLQRELDHAARIQRSILPSELFHQLGQGLEVATYFEPARTVGGDFYDVIAIDADRVAYAVGDVSGKGMPAALFMVQVITLLRSICTGRGDLSRILPELNRHLCQANPEMMFVTLAILVLDHRRNRITYLNAGHNPVLLSRAGRPFETWLTPPGIMLGIEPRAQFGLEEIDFTPDVAVVVYTDGLTEAENPRGEQYGLLRASAVLSASPKAPMAARIDTLITDLSRFTAGAPVNDDVTLLGLGAARQLPTRPPFEG